VQCQRIDSRYAVEHFRTVTKGLAVAGMLDRRYSPEPLGQAVSRLATYLLITSYFWAGDSLLFS
jgi:hypothetical protein